MFSEPWPYTEAGVCPLVFRRRHVYKVFGRWPPRSRPRSTAILDGEIACVGHDGRPQFFDLMLGLFYAFDLLSGSCEGLLRGRVCARPRELWAS